MTARLLKTQRQQRGYMHADFTGCLVWLVVLAAFVGMWVLPTVLRWLGAALVWIGERMQ